MFLQGQVWLFEFMFSIRNSHNGLGVVLIGPLEFFFFAPILPCFFLFLRIYSETDSGVS